MDSSLFDDLVRAWAAGGASRRRVLRMAAGSAVGGLAGWPDHRPADARTRQQCKKIKNKRRRKKCLKSLDSAPLNSACAIASDCPAPTSACDGATCADGACGTTPRICDDGVACTADACDEGSGGCTHIPDNQLCGDDRFCDPVQGYVCLTHLTPCGDSCFQPGPRAPPVSSESARPESRRVREPTSSAWRSTPPSPKSATGSTTTVMARATKAPSARARQMRKASVRKARAPSSAKPAGSTATASWRTGAK